VERVKGELVLNVTVLLLVAKSLPCPLAFFKSSPSMIRVLSLARWREGLRGGGKRFCGIMWPMLVQGWAIHMLALAPPAVGSGFYTRESQLRRRHQQGGSTAVVFVLARRWVGRWRRIFRPGRGAPDAQPGRWQVGVAGRRRWRCDGRAGLRDSGARWRGREGEGISSRVGPRGRRSQVVVHYDRASAGQVVGRAGPMARSARHAVIVLVRMLWLLGDSRGHRSLGLQLMVSLLLLLMLMMLLHLHLGFHPVTHGLRTFSQFFPGVLDGVQVRLMWRPL